MRINGKILLLIIVTFIAGLFSGFWINAQHVQKLSENDILTSPAFYKRDLQSSNYEAIKIYRERISELEKIKSCK